MASSSSSSSKRKREMEEENAFHGMAPAPPSPPPNSDDPFHRYDVFINHRGPDVKNTVASIIYQFLQFLGLQVFLDLDLQVGNCLSANIQHAIRRSRVHIAIFSKGYANSPWCLAELRLMLETGAKIVPLFYDVTPTDVRYPEKGVYADAFVTHEKKGRYTIEKLEQWKQALHQVSFTTGIEFPPSNGNMGSLYKKIVDTVIDEVREARNSFKLEIAEHPVGLEETFQELEAKISTIEQSSNGNGQIVGIVGTTGVGKTTLAKEFFNRKHPTFCRSSFLFEVGEAHRNKNMGKMQHKLMHDLSMPLPFSSSNFQPSSSKEGSRVEMIKSQLEHWYPKTLIILDGVDHADQLEALAVNEFLNHGALIIVTCRDANVLQSFQTGRTIHEMRGLDLKYARELFCWQAFRRLNPPNGYEKWVELNLDVSHGLPSVLKELGQGIFRMQNDIDAG